MRIDVLAADSQHTSVNTLQIKSSKRVNIEFNKYSVHSIDTDRHGQVWVELAKLEVQWVYLG